MKTWLAFPWNTPKTCIFKFCFGNKLSANLRELSTSVLARNKSIVEN